MQDLDIEAVKASYPAVRDALFWHWLIAEAEACRGVAQRQLETASSWQECLKAQGELAGVKRICALLHKMEP